MSKRHDAVRQSGLMEQGEEILGDEQAIFSVAPGRKQGGFVVQTDRALYICVQGGLGLGKVKEVHRLAVANGFRPRIKHGGVSRDSWDVGFLAHKDRLTIGSEIPSGNVNAEGLDDVKLEDVRFVVVSFRSTVEGQRWSSCWDEAVRIHRGQ